MLTDERYLKKIWPKDKEDTGERHYALSADIFKVVASFLDLLPIEEETEDNKKRYSELEEYSILRIQ